MVLGFIITLYLSWEIIIEHQLFKKGKILSGWFTNEERSHRNTSINFLNIDNITLYNEGNIWGIISITITEYTFDNYYIHILHDLSNLSIYIWILDLKVN